MEITAQDAAQVLFNCATMLEMKGDNPYRIAAYRNAARVLLRLGPLAPRAAANEEVLEALGFGKRLRAKLQELFSTGGMQFYEELLAQQPLPVARLMRLPGIGPKTALRLVNELGIRSPRALARAATTGELERNRGFGPRRAALWAVPPSGPRQLEMAFDGEQPAKAA